MPRTRYAVAPLLLLLPLLLVAAGRAQDAESEGWTLPFSLDALFAPPSAAEIEGVRKAWLARDLRAADATVVEVEPYDLGRVRGEIRIVSHRVHGSLHYGAVIVPGGAAPRSCAVIVDAKGVSWDYFPRNLDSPPGAVVAAASDQAKYVTFVPGYRGERLILGNRTFLSEGDRTDVWDGAADDAIAFLTAALRVTPEADPERIGIFGRSRGGTVALLAGARDPRIRAVVAWAAPTDHFTPRIEQSGWARRESVELGLRHESPPSAVGGQFIELFLRGAIARKHELGDVRRHLLAGSPLYFADTLPATQIHYGEDDRIVPQRNGRELARRRPDADAHFYPRHGHDTDSATAYRLTGAFFAKMLLAPTPGATAGRTGLAKNASRHALRVPSDTKVRRTR